jgi:O-antigen ligase
VNTAQQLMQRGLSALDPWLDAVFPIATALICARQRLAGYSLLVIYLLLRLLQRSDREPWRWILISLLIVNAGLIIEDRDLRPGGPSDYLIVALSFAAGFQRTKEQWIRGLIWMCGCILPLLALSLAAGDKLIEGTSSFSGFNINKLGFLAGLLTVLAYGWLRQAKSIANKCVAIAAMGSGITEAMLTQSRASLAVPLLAIIVDLATSRRWTLKQLLITGALCVALASGAIYNWYFHTSTTYNLATDYRLGELNRAETIQCWFQTTARSSRGTWLGLGYGKPAQDQCGPERIPSLRTMEKSQGLQHAHNFYAQIFTETGIGGLILAAGITLAGFHQAWKQHNRATLAFTLPLMIYLTLMSLGITYWQVMMINQVLVGYSLAALTATDRDPSAADAATPAPPPGASAPQG